MDHRDLQLVFFGMAVDAVGATRGTLRCPWPITAKAVRDALLAHYPALVGMPFHLAQGAALLSGDAVLQDRLELVILPPFAGG